MRNRIARIEHIARKRLDTAQDRFELWLPCESATSPASRGHPPPTKRFASAAYVRRNNHTQHHRTYTKFCRFPW